MSKVLQRIDTSLRSFYIFNSRFGQQEGEEHKKILYYHPSDIELNTKIIDVGLSEAIITFTSTFTSNEDDCKALHTQKTTQLFYQPEPGYWMVLVLNVPKEIKSKDGIEVNEYRGGDLSDRIYKAVLQQCYYMYRLLTGTFQLNMKESTADAFNDTERLLLVERLKLFYDNYLLSLNLANRDIVDVMRSIQYLALDKSLFLRAHNFINMIRATFLVIEETILLYNEQIVCSGNLDSIDLYSLHEHIICNVLNSVQNANSSISSDMYDGGAFITGPDNQSQSMTPTKVYLTIRDKLQPYFLIVYRALNVTLCLFVRDSEQLRPEIYTELHAFMGPQLSSLARDIDDQMVKPHSSFTNVAWQTCADLTDHSSSSVSPKYLFINEQSLKHHTNFCTERSKRSKIASNYIPRNVMNLIADLAITDSSSASIEEFQLKTTNDFWIVKRRCNWRQYYVIILNNKATLLDITQEAKRIFEQELKDDVFFDK